MALFINLIPLLGSLILVTSQLKTSDAKRSRAYAKCQFDECTLQPQYFTLYSTVKKALDSDFDLNGKEILPFIRSVDVLSRRFSKNEELKLNGSELVKNLLSNETLASALKVFNSDDGRLLVSLYRSPVNGKDQNLACSQQRVQDLDWAAKKFEGENDAPLGRYFFRIHRNFVKKSAKKCLKSSCNSVDKSMSKIDSILGKNQVQETDNTSPDDNRGDGNNSTVPKKREFEQEELELCKFFKKSNESSCEISGQELSEINLSKNREEETKTLLQAYYANRLKIEGQENVDSQKQLEEAGRAIVAQCRPIKELLDYHLAGLRWYRERNLIEEQRFTLRTLWCPSLSYWYQIDRLCDELQNYDYSSNETFAYEVATTKHADLSTQSDGVTSSK